jgi:hypothetical protein
MLNYVYITINQLIPEVGTVTEIITREICSFLAVPHTVPVWRDALSVHCACPSLRQ